jgi:hypothetical protein
VADDPPFRGNHFGRKEVLNKNSQRPESQISYEPSIC